VSTVDPRTERRIDMMADLKQTCCYCPESILVGQKTIKIGNVVAHRECALARSRAT
jgi:hypothetical protein